MGSQGSGIPDLPDCKEALFCLPIKILSLSLVIETFEFAATEGFVGNTLTLAEGASRLLAVTLSAKPSGLPMLSRASGTVNMQRVGVVEDGVQFTEVTRDDAGDYSLTFSNVAGSMTLDFTVVVECEL